MHTTNAHATHRDRDHVADSLDRRDPHFTQLQQRTSGPASHNTNNARIEKVTGINFLPGVSGSKREEMENYKAQHLWGKE